MFKMRLSNWLLRNLSGFGSIGYNDQGLCVRAGEIRLNFDHERLARLTQNPSYMMFKI